MTAAADNTALAAPVAAEATPDQAPEKALAPPAAATPAAAKPKPKAPKPESDFDALIRMSYEGDREGFWRLMEKSGLKEKLSEAYPHILFVPTPGQEKFLYALDEGVQKRGHFDFANLSGNWWGKSTMVANICINLPQPVEMMAPIFRRLKTFREWRWPKYIRLGCTASEMAEIGGDFWQQIKRWWPKDGSWKSAKGSLDYPSKFWLPNGWEMDVMAFDRPPEVKESITVGLYITTEPPRPADWTAAAGRRKRGGLRIVFGTMVLNTPDMVRFYGMVSEDERCECMFARTDENFVSKGGHLPDEQTAEMMKAWPEEERDARESGKPVFMSGTVFDLDEAVHFIPRDRVPADGVTIGICDPHPVKPWCVTVGRVDRLGIRYVIDEWPKPADYGGKMFHKIAKDTHGISHYASAMVELNKKWKCDFWVIDARFAAQQNREDEYAVTLRRKLYDDYGLEFVDGNKTVLGTEESSLPVLKDLLSWDRTMPLDFKNRPRLYICDDLKNVRYQMMNLTRDEFGRLDKRLEDFPRSLMYFVMADDAGYHPPLVVEDDRQRKIKEYLDEAASHHPEWNRGWGARQPITRVLQHA